MTKISSTLRLAAVAAGALCVAAPPAASADSTVPSAPVATAASSLSGWVSDFNGPYALVVRDARGVERTVKLHRGTVILPTGVRLQLGMRVALTGAAGSGAFQADRIVADLPKPAPPSSRSSSAERVTPSIWGRAERGGGPPAPESHDPVLPGPNR